MWLCCSGDMGAALMALPEPRCEAELQQGHSKSWGCNGAPPGWETLGTETFFTVPPALRLSDAHGFGLEPCQSRFTAPTRFVYCLFNENQ